MKVFIMKQEEYKVRGLGLNKEVWAMALELAKDQDMKRAGYMARLIKKEHAKLKKRAENEKE